MMDNFLIDLIKQISCEVCTIIIIELLKHYQEKNHNDKNNEELMTDVDEINEVYDSIKKIRLELGISDKDFEKACEKYRLVGDWQ